jgi:hypothetical protein
MADLLKILMAYTGGTDLEAASKGRNCLDPDGSDWTQMDAVETGLNRLKRMYKGYVA